MLQAALVLALSASAIAAPSTYSEPKLTSDIGFISKHWGQISPYSDNEPSIFGVKDVGLPDGCQVEQVHLLQRHANRFPTGAYDDGVNDAAFAQKLTNYTSRHGSKGFKGKLEFLNTYQYIMSTSLLTGRGAVTEFSAGVDFWNKYGRTLYNATVGQLAYNASAVSKKDKPVLRTTSQSRIENSQINWALGFFGPSFEAVPNPKLTDVTDPFDVVIIPEGGTENNTLASYDSCFQVADPVIGYIGDLSLYTYIPKYLTAATKRMQEYAPDGFKFNTNDTYAMQSLCAYETGYIGSSDFCEGLFTEDEWKGFENTLDMEYYYDYSFGNPTGRAQGLGYVEELVARLTKQLITSSDSSVNYTISNNEKDFPLGRPFYADFSHDDILVSVLTAISIDYFKSPPSYKDVPPKSDRHFILSRMTPFAARLVTEVIGCSSSKPAEVKNKRTQYYPGQYGYEKSKATHKFVRMRLNDGIVPLATMRGGKCAGRKDGLCALESYLTGVAEASKLANYQYACFGNYSVSYASALAGKDYDGTIFKK